ncbi:hypothetical protein GCM10009641_51180 [Mycobacterium cookii]|uniref:DUF732 domain-containing protein n=1 Tax=Mycobacterium cookii TaxID=1775 RepID=A0A7I7KV49_9MYCO|nr:DUF732 domain-containing protein [Mycobacterium cookii]MCV7329188.1 hypothetical protein [Mycobacterium cookii]BBX45684.1 hypothetical protein MCOO_16990 [Mycobacterium cookii]
MSQTVSTRQHRYPNVQKLVVLASIAAAALAGVAAALAIAAPARAASIDTNFDICGALRSGTSLASIETSLEARGYTATKAGTLTGNTIRVQCPEQAAPVMAQIS